MVVYPFAIEGQLDKFERHLCTACETDDPRGDSARRLSSKYDTPLPRRALAPSSKAPSRAPVSAARSLGANTYRQGESV